jgi:hypothetical protein
MRRELEHSRRIVTITHKPFDALGQHGAARLSSFEFDDT